MTDVKEIFAAVLETPQPPLAPGEAIVRTARRAVRRSRAMWAGLATVTVVAGSFAWTAVTWGPPATPVTAAPSTTESVDPQWEEIYAIMGRMGDVVVRALPPGVVADGTGAGEGALDGDTNALTVVGTTVEVQKDGGHGQVMAFWLARPGAAPTGDLCAVPWVNSFLVMTDDNGMLVETPDLSCSVVEVNGVAIRVGARMDMVGRQSVSAPYAIHYVDGGLVIAFEVPYSNGYVEHPVPMLTSPIFTDQELAALAADPRLIP